MVCLRFIAMELTTKLGIRWVFGIFTAAAFAALTSRAETDPKFYAVMASAEVRTSPAQITLSWNQDPNAIGYTISRRNGNSWNTVATLPGSTLTWSDSNVSVGTTYEYRFSKTTSLGYRGTSFLLAGINAPLKDSFGKVILLVDDTYAAELATELRRLEWDLAGDGWTVLRHDVSRNDSVRNIKEIVKADYYSDPSNVKAVFIFGHVPVPYSGNYSGWGAPDGHQDHGGAWTADLFYGEIDGTWTDNVSNTGSAKPWNHNLPGDGKLDQNNIASDVELAVGRVDFFNMTCFANKTPARSELDLLRAYLNKDHDFRHRVFSVARRGLVCDNFGERDGEAFAASGWRNMGAFFGAENVTKVPYGQYFSTLASEDYLWSYGTGGGYFHTCNGIGSSDDFATTEIRSVFTMFLGSYFGDWDNESAFMRAALGSGYALTTSWAGRPHWFYHHMGLGEPISVSTLASQNNIYASSLPDGGQYGRGTHVALLGDPTLRMHPVIPVSNLRGTANGSSMALTWNASTDTEIQGYHIYRGAGPNAGFTRLTSGPVSGTSFTDNNYSSGATYMVRAVKLEQSGSGTYFNASQGVFYPANGGGGTAPNVPSAAANLAATAVSAAQINLSWQDTSGNETGFRVERRAGAGMWTQVASLGANVTSYSSTGLAPGTSYSFRVIAFNTSGSGAPSNEASATTSAPTATSAAATFLGTDSNTSGSWRGVFGQEGHHVITGSSALPGYATVTASGKTDHYWNSQTSDSRALESTTGGRVAGCWYANNSFTVDVAFLDGASHKFSLYFLDWDRLARSQRVEVLDAQSGAVLDTRTVSSFANGIYLSWNLKGAIRFRFTKLTGPNAVVNGMFFDAAGASGTGTSKAGGLIAGNFHLQITGAPGEKFDVFASENLSGWTKVATVTLTESIYNFIDTAANGKTRRFYRAVATP